MCKDRRRLQERCNTEVIQNYFFKQIDIVYPLHWIILHITEMQTNKTDFNESHIPVKYDLPLIFKDIICINFCTKYTMSGQY